jgi:hypothetical protein
MREAFRHAIGLPHVPDTDLGEDDYAPYVSQAEFEQDVGLAIGLFDSFEQDDKGTISAVHVDPGSPAEREARAAMARLVRAGTWTTCGRACQAVLRWLHVRLATLLDSGDNDDEFELVLRRRAGKKKGPAPSHALNTSIAYSLALKIKSDGCTEAAVSDAARRYAVSERTVWNVWKDEGRDILNTWNFIDADHRARPAE